MSMGGSVADTRTMAAAEEAVAQRRRRFDEHLKTFKQDKVTRYIFMHPPRDTALLSSDVIYFLR
jgi:hypothetical protein